LTHVIFSFPNFAFTNSNCTATARPQLQALAAGVEIIVATPGRLVDFLSRQPPMLSLSRCNFLVLDEAGLYKLNPVHPYLESAWFESAWFESA
jgi:hypothetical protein